MVRLGRGLARGMLLAVLLAAGPARAAKPEFDFEKLRCCEYDRVQGFVWSGTDPVMPLERLAAYCAPILWFSPDEPLLEKAEPGPIRVPTAFPFEAKPDGPVVYYRLRDIMRRGEGPSEPYVTDAEARGKSPVDLSRIRSLELDFFFYYPSEEGFGGHPHDVESVEMSLFVWSRPQCSECPYSLGIAKIVGKAHGVLWYDNTLRTDQDTKFPLTILVEEGKHASCTDKNGDGYFTPGYDVNRRVNDAWGVRDVIRGGGLFSGGFESWFAKVRNPTHRVFPRLPEDSPHRARIAKTIAQFSAATYELRPFPRSELAADDPHLVPFIADKGPENWPEVFGDSGVKALRHNLDSEGFARSLSTSLRVDGNVGVSFVFPLFIVKNYSDPLAGGWILNRIYLKDTGLRDFGYNLLYTTSASRWIDGYFSVGFESDEGENHDSRSFWCAETGFKFRANIRHSPLKFMSKLTDFWGFRIGTKADGLLPIERLGLVLEIGAGTF
jgi:hypothetical protein